MKIIYLFIFLIILGCNERIPIYTTSNDIEYSNVDSFEVKQNNSSYKVDTTGKQKIIDETIKGFNEFDQFKIYKTSDSIKVDFNGDSLIDIVYFIQKNGVKKLIIKDGMTKQSQEIGNGKSFDGVLDDVSWVDFWGTTIDSETGEIVIENSEVAGDRVANLDQISLFLRKLESGGGVVTYRKKDKKYIWVHQSC